ncbi:ribosomal small subunit pseudouridine synthase A [Andreesenia angusta]|uniref:Pseudouridine synthase n=1 Tax=Andreesenia angusta TaxID=39480 RepID=A0A1S1V752_9FIRM|nr:pseudouridine synthase [Andreesenia angusta]OHW62245.1 ribosomal small subunit pseudouridine synthase A [Andreesenia angusta]
MKKERLDKVLANLGYGSRKEIKSLAKTGIIKIDGEIVKDSSHKFDPESSVIEVGEEVVRYRKYIYLMMNKPDGYISSTEDCMHETVLDLLEPEDRVFEPFPLGRLDKDTEGLLVLSNDGQLAHRILSPKKHVKKGYYAEVEGVVTEEDIEDFAEGVELEDGYITMPAKLKILESGEISKIELEIYEGKYHQVKRMFESVGKRVVYLKRIYMGGLALDESLELGEYRELTDEEVELLEIRD